MNEQLFKFAETLNDEVLNLIQDYNTTQKPKADILSQIKLRLDVLMPIKDIQLKTQQIEATKQLTEGEFMKNFSMKDIVSVLKGVTNGQ